MFSGIVSHGDSGNEVLKIGLTNRMKLYELIVFLGLVMPSMLFSFFAVKTGSVSFILTAWATLARDFSLIGLVLFFLWRNGEPVARQSGRGDRDAFSAGFYRYPAPAAAVWSLTKRRCVNCERIPMEDNHGM